MVSFTASASEAEDQIWHYNVNDNVVLFCLF